MSSEGTYTVSAGIFAPSAQPFVIGNETVAHGRAYAGVDECVEVMEVRRSTGMLLRLRVLVLILRSNVADHGAIMSAGRSESQLSPRLSNHDSDLHTCHIWVIEVVLAN